MRTGLLAIPEHLHGLSIFASPWVIGAAAIGLTVEFFADKIPLLDTLWDTIHTLIRPVGGALLAAAIVDPQDPVWQVVCLLLGGSAALLNHGAKSGTRAVVNLSPEPVTNLVGSVSEDGVAGALLLLAYTHPQIAIFIAAALAAAALTAIFILWCVWRRIRATSSNLPNHREEPSTPDGGS